MDIRCHNCGHLAVSTDAVCRHCGEALPELGDEDNVTSALGLELEETPSLSHIGLYGALTVATVVAAVLVMQALGREPLVQANLGGRPPAGWQLVTTADQGITLMLPNDWEWFDASHSDGQKELAKITAGGELLAVGTYPLGEEVHDMTPLFLARSSSHSEDYQREETQVSGERPFLVVVGSTQLNRLGYEQAASLLTLGNYPIEELEVVDNFDLSHLSLAVERPAGAGIRMAWSCQQQFIRGELQGMLVSACAPTVQYGRYREHFGKIMFSFQRLKR